MCYNPLHLQNPSFGSARHIDADGVVYKGKQRFCNDVPCGKCDACRQQRTDAYILRCQTEFAKCNNRALFVTLTYDDAHLPIYNYHIDPIFEPNHYEDSGDCTLIRYGEVLQEISYKSVSCWNKKHVQKFLKSYNEKLIYYIGKEIKGLTRLATINGHRQITPEWRAFLDEIRGKNPLKYFLVCERGHANIYTDDYGRQRVGTSRPHYHAILFIEDSRVSMAHALRLVDECWQQGHTYNVQITSRQLYIDESFSNKEATDRSFSNSIEYICKYVNKDSTDIIETCYFYTHDDEITHKPFMLISRNVGASLFDNYSPDMIVKEYLDGHSISSSSSPTGTRNVAISNYYADKVGLKVTIKRKSTTYFPVEFVQERGFLQPIFPPSYLLENVPCIKSESFTTPFGEHVNSLLSHHKATHYKELLEFVQVNQPDSSYLNLDACLMVSPADFYNYVLNLHRFRDDSGSGDIEYLVYSCLRDYEHNLSKQKRHEHEIAYKSGLYKAIEKNPSLFNLKPLHYED